MLRMLSIANAMKPYLKDKKNKTITNAIITMLINAYTHIAVDFIKHTCY